MRRSKCIASSGLGCSSQHTSNASVMNSLCGRYPLRWRYLYQSCTRGFKLDCGYRVDMVVAGAVVVEVKAIERVAPVHEAQLLTYLRMGGWKAGLLINFNVPVLRHGIVRRVLGLEE